MNPNLLIALAFAAAPLCGQTGGNWVLEASTLTYHVSHPLHQTEGTSHAARGRGVCLGGQCEFLVAAPLKSFDSGDSNRDLHMLQVCRGGEFPMVSVRTRVPQADSTLSTIVVDLDVSFAGQTAHYRQLQFQRVSQGDETRISGTIPLLLSDFKIDPPSLFAIPVKDEIPVRVDMTWRKAN